MDDTEGTTFGFLEGSQARWILAFGSGEWPEDMMGLTHTV